MARNKVDLPEPEGPETKVVAPASIVSPSAHTISRPSGRHNTRSRNTRSRPECSVCSMRDPPRRLVQSFRALWGEDVKAEGTSRVTWAIEPVGDSCLLKVTHDQLPEGANNQLYGGWPMVLSGIKTLLETGEILTTPGSLRWLQRV